MVPIKIRLIYSKSLNCTLAHTRTKFYYQGRFQYCSRYTSRQENGKLDTHKRCRQKITDILETYDLTDIWRDKHPTLKHFTWHSSHKPPIFMSIPIQAQMVLKASIYSAFTILVQTKAYALRLTNWMSGIKKKLEYLNVISWDLNYPFEDDKYFFAVDRSVALSMHRNKKIQVWAHMRPPPFWDN